MKIASCTFEDSFLYSARFLSLSLHFLTSLDIPIHIFGAYLIYSKTPKSMKSAKYSIMQLHIACSFMDFYVSFLMIFYVWIPSPSGFPVGLLSFLGVDSGIQVLVWEIVMSVVALSAVAFFENRYDVIVIGQIGRSETRNLKRIVYFFMNFLVCVLGFGYSFWISPDLEYSRSVLHVVQPCIPLELINNPKYVNMNVGSAIVPMITGTIFVSIPLQGAYFFFFTLYSLFFSVRNVSKATQKMQKKFFLAMFLQAFIPMAAFFAPLSYYFLAYFYFYYNQMYNNFAMIAIGFNGLLTTIVMILVHAPYRDAALDFFGLVKYGTQMIRSSRIFTKQRSQISN